MMHTAELNFDEPAPRQSQLCLSFQVAVRTNDLKTHMQKKKFCLTFIVRFRIQEFN